ncbi:MAG: formate dehydrogenase, partial [Selenomonas artemidis]
MLINKEYVPRHKMAFAVCHWMNAFAFFMLFLTALPLYSDSFRFMYHIFGDKTLMYA